MNGQGAGRGSLLEMLRKQNEQKRLAAEAATTDASETGAAPTETPKVAFGRAQLLAKVRTQMTSTSSTHSSDTSMSTSVGGGRGSLLSSLQSRQNVPQPQVDPAGVTGSLAELSLAKSSSSSEASVTISRQGTSGTTIGITANYIDLVFEPGAGAFQYLVKFEPDIDSRPLRSNLLNQHKEHLGNARAFDGSILNLGHKLPNDRTIFQSVHPSDQSNVKLTIIFKKEQKMSENVPFFNVLLNRVMRRLDLVRIGQQNFHPKSAHRVEGHRLELWPGYNTAISEVEGGVKLNIDATHRVIRMDTVRDFMNDLVQKNPRNFKNAVINDIVGTSVLTRYNNRTYRIDDVDFDVNPMTTFDKGGAPMTYVEYYKSHWNIPIKDLQQPLLVYVDKKKTTTGERIEQKIFLVPELCYLAGLTDDMRSDFRLMREMAKTTQVCPEPRRRTILKFVTEVNSNPEAKKILSDWGLSLQPKTTSLKGRVLEEEKIIYGKGKTAMAGNQANWSNSAVRNPVLYTPNLNNWCILYTRKDERSCRDFKEMVQKVSGAMQIRIGEPQLRALQDDRSDTFVRELRSAISGNNLEMVVIIMPTNRNDRYSAIKKLCCVDMPIPSQVIIGKTISNPAKLKAIVEKITLQMNCKLGGALWSVRIPFNNCMVCGVDVYHGGVGQGKRGSIAGFVASLDQPLTKWYSKICIQGPHQELVDLLKICLSAALTAFKEENGRYPDKIFIFRDGVGDGQLDTVKNYEVKQLLSTFSNIDASYSPALCVIVVQKRINTRLMSEGRGQLENPPPGTIVDTEITRKSYYDFFLVPQTSRQGTVTPTHYIVVHDTSETKTDYIQRFTYKLCHLYYNWPGTIRVPAPCQYAHKLAYLVGQSIQMEPHQNLSKLLYFL